MIKNRQFFSPLLAATFWMLGTLASFVLMAIAGRELSANLSTFQILFFRSLVGIAVISVVLTWKGWAQVKTRQIGTHLIRNFVHFLGQYGWFYGIALIPLAEVFAIEFTVPVWTAIIAALVLGERITRGRAIAIALGVAGVLVILRPGIAVLSVGALAVLGGAISYGLSHTLTKKLSGTDTPLAIVFYMTVIQMPLGLIPAMYDWAVLSYEMPSGGMWWCPWIFFACL